MAKQLLIETMPVLFEVLEQASDKNKGTMKVRGTFGVADEINGNGRVYPEEIEDREIEKLNEIIEDRCAYAEADHPGDGRSTIKNTAARLTKKIEKVVVNGRKTYIGEALVLPTEPGGKNLQVMIATGGKVHVSQRGFGSLVEKTWNGKRADVVQEDYNLKTFDFVIGGSTKGAEVEQLTEQIEVINLIEAGPCEGCQKTETQTKKGGSLVMEIKTLDELRKAYPDLCEQMVKIAVEAREKELKETLQKEWDESAKQIAEGIKKQIEESQEYKDFKAGMEKHKAALVEIAKLVKSYVSEPAPEETGIEERLASVEARLKAATDENKALKEQAEKEKIEAGNKDKVAKKIQEVTAGKEHEKLLVERLQGCKTPEEVAARVVEEEGFIKKLLTEQKPGNQPRGDGKPLNENKEGDGILTEQQKKDRQVAGLA